MKVILKLKRYFCKHGITLDVVERIQKYAREQAYQDTNQETYQAMEALIHNLNTMNSRAGAQVPLAH